jgi:hypothetical protein
VWGWIFYPVANVRTLIVIIIIIIVLEWWRIVIRDLVADLLLGRSRPATLNAASCLALMLLLEYCCSNTLDTVVWSFYLYQYRGGVQSRQTTRNSLALHDLSNQSARAAPRPPPRLYQKKAKGRRQKCDATATRTATRASCLPSWGTRETKRGGVVSVYIIIIHIKSNALLLLQLLLLLLDSPRLLQHLCLLSTRK